MEDQIQDSVIFSIHILLLTAKLILLFVIANKFVFTRSNDKKSFMLIGRPLQIILSVFTFSVLSAEAWILTNYYLIYSNFYYELLSMLDQLILTVLLIISYKGGNNGS